VAWQEIQYGVPWAYPTDSRNPKTAYAGDSPKGGARTVFLVAAPYVMTVLLLVAIASVYIAASTAPPSIFANTYLPPDSPVMGDMESASDWLSSDDPVAVTMRDALSVILPNSAQTL
jgi:hypothetical protein